jgi:hypothetical protein
MCRIFICGDESVAGRSWRKTANGRNTVGGAVVLGPIRPSVLVIGFNWAFIYVDFGCAKFDLLPSFRNVSTA